jgi:hypothetical protein
LPHDILPLSWVIAQSETPGTRSLCQAANTGRVPAAYPSAPLLNLRGFTLLSTAENRTNPPSVKAIWSKASLGATACLTGSCTRLLADCR